MILAHLGEEYLQSLLSNIDMISYTKNTVMTETFVVKTEEIRLRGYAISYEETVLDAGAVSAPIF
jgi:DNA-binding IclR family transcriptional regulator